MEQEKIPYILQTKAIGEAINKVVKNWLAERTLA